MGINITIKTSADSLNFINLLFNSYSIRPHLYMQYVHCMDMIA